MAQEFKYHENRSRDEDEYLLDMVFVLDCTGSMASYINSARKNIVQISKSLGQLAKQNQLQAKAVGSNSNESKTQESSNNNDQIEGHNESKFDCFTKLSCKFAVVAYRDIPPQATSL